MKTPCVFDGRDDTIVTTSGFVCMRQYNYERMITMTIASKEVTMTPRDARNLAALLHHHADKMIDEGKEGFGD